jgi:hypothetical protein
LTGDFVVIAPHEAMFSVQPVENRVRVMHSDRAPEHVAKVPRKISFAYDRIVIGDKHFIHIIDRHERSVAEFDYVRVPVMLVTRKE